MLGPRTDDRADAGELGAIGVSRTRSSSLRSADRLLVRTRMRPAAALSPMRRRRAEEVEKGERASEFERRVVGDVGAAVVTRGADRVDRSEPTVGCDERGGQGLVVELGHFVDESGCCLHSTTPLRRPPRRQARLGSGSPSAPRIPLRRVRKVGDEGENAQERVVRIGRWSPSGDAACYEDTMFAGCGTDPPSQPLALTLAWQGSFVRVDPLTSAFLLGSRSADRR